MKRLLLCVVVEMVRLCYFAAFYPTLVGRWQYLAEFGRTAEIEFDALCRCSLEWRDA